MLREVFFSASWLRWKARVRSIPDEFGIMRGGMAGGGAKLTMVDGGQSMSKGTLSVFQQRN